MAWSPIIMCRVVMIKKPISPNFDHSKRFLTDYIPQNFAFSYAYVNWLLVTPRFFVSRGILNMIDI